MRIFISHVAAEAPMALALKETLEGSFPGGVFVFVSSSAEDLIPGEKWLEKIENELKRSDLLIVICSPASLSRPWINFELGCGCMRGLNVIPICHAGQAKDFHRTRSRSRHAPASKRLETPIPGYGRAACSLGVSGCNRRTHAAACPDSADQSSYSLAHF
jgi:TIR domain